MPDIPDLKQLRFATDPGKTTEPIESKKDIGHVDREEPSPLNMNWMFNKTFERLKFLQGNESHIIVGSQTQKDDFTADFLVTELSDAIISDSSNVMFLEGNHILTADLTLNNSKLKFCDQSSSSVIVISTPIFELAGANLKGDLNVHFILSAKLVISGADIQGLNIRLDFGSLDNIDFTGSGTIIVNGKIITRQLILLELSNQPDQVVLTASEQALYANDDRFVRYDQISQTFLRRDDTPVAISDGSWVVVKSMETLTNHLIFDSERLTINSYRGFQLNLGNQGENIPWTVFIKGQNCLVSLFMTQSLRELATILGDDKFNAMATNGLSSMENRRVIKNQGESNCIKYNGELIFHGGAPTAHMDFVKPNHPYLLEWDGFIYEGLLRDLPSFPTLDNKLKCWFTDLYYWLDRRFNDQLLFPDTTIAYHTVSAPPASAAFMRPRSLADEDRHSRIVRLGEVADVILTAEYSQVADKIILGTNAANNIKKVKNGQRVDATGLPGGGTGTTLVRPGSIVTAGGSESFLLMDAEDNTPVTATASGNLTLDFSGMAAGSAQSDTFQNITGSFESRNASGSIDQILFTPGVNGAFDITLDDGIFSGSDCSVAGPNNIADTMRFDASQSPNARTSPADEGRPINNLGIPYYKL